MKKKWGAEFCVMCAFACLLTAVSAFAQEPYGMPGGEETFRPVSEDLLPFRNRMVSVELRDTPLRDSIYSIVTTTGLNLILERGVDPETPVTISVKNISAERAIQLILDAAGYFFKLDGNVLTVKATDTRIFEFGQPSVMQEYSVEVGGDILGTAIESTEGFGGDSGGGGGGGGEDDMRGKVQQTITTDKKAYNFWDSIEAGLGRILNGGEGATGAGTGEQEAPQNNYYDINRMTGTILVTAGKQELDTVERYIASIRESLNRQVIIEARIVEVKLSKGLRYGIDWTWLASESAMIGTNNFRGIVNQTEPNVEVHVSRSDFTGLMRAIETQGTVRTLSNPRINIMNGQTALLSVGRSRNFLSSVESDIQDNGDGVIVTYTTNTNSVLSGIMVGIVPYIDRNGDVSMTITPIISDLVDLEERSIGDQGTSISLPTVDLRQLSTTVKVKDGEMVVIGGLMQNRKRAQDDQVPIVGNIPLLGYLFKRFDDSDEQTDIVILLKPTLKI